MVHTVTVEELLPSQGFCHLNTLIVRRALYEEIGGMEEASAGNMTGTSISG